MPGPLVHVGAVSTCLHGGAVTVPPPGRPRVLVDRTRPVVTVKEVHTVAGCPFQIPIPTGTKPQPCVTVRLESAPRILVDGSPALILTAAALGFSAEQIPQGPPSATAIQTKVLAG